MNKNTELIIQFNSGDRVDIRTFTLVKYNDLDSKPEIWHHDNIIEFKYVSMGIIRTKIIPITSIKSAEFYEE